VVNQKEGNDVTVEGKWKMIAKEKLPALLSSVKEMGTYFVRSNRSSTIKIKLFMAVFTTAILY